MSKNDHIRRQALKLHSFINMSFKIATIFEMLNDRKDCEHLYSLK